MNIYLASVTSGTGSSAAFQRLIPAPDDYDFVDAFNLNTTPVWIGPQELVYNQLPIMIAIENHRSGLIWDLFVSCPEVKAGMRKLGFTAPYL